MGRLWRIQPKHDVMCDGQKRMFGSVCTFNMSSQRELQLGSGDDLELRVEFPKGGFSFEMLPCVSAWPRYQHLEGRNSPENGGNSSSPMLRVFGSFSKPPVKVLLSLIFVEFTR